MCTAVTFLTSDNLHFSARTMDFSFELDANPVYVPRKYKFKSLVPDTEFVSKYGFIGMGKDIDGFTFADGFNERGFSIASLYFEKNAKYNEKSKKDALNIASTEMVSWALGNIESVAEFENYCQKINVVAVINPLLQVNVPLHWIVADKTGNTGVLEITKDGSKFYHNSVGVMTNSPEFPWHLDNLNHYTNLQPTEFEPKQYGDYTTVSDGPGSGALGLPGDYTAASRFVRAAFLRQYSAPVKGTKAGVNAVLHILNAVDIPKGVKVTAKDVSDYTQYKAVMDLDNLSYYFMAYDDTKLNQVEITEDLLQSSEIKMF